MKRFFSILLLLTLAISGSSFQAMNPNLRGLYDAFQRAVDQNNAREIERIGKLLDQYERQLVASCQQPSLAELQQLMNDALQANDIERANVILQLIIEQTALSDIIPAPAFPSQLPKQSPNSQLVPPPLPSVPVPVVTPVNNQVSIVNFNHARDLAEMVELFKAEHHFLIDQSSGAPYTADHFATDMKNAGSFRGYPLIIKVLRIDNKFAGFITYQLKKEQHTQVRNVGHIVLVAVKKEFRGKGYGKKLLEHAIGQLERNKVDYIEIGVAKDNHLAHGLYKNLGFEDAYTVSQSIMLKKWYNKTDFGPCFDVYIPVYPSDILENYSPENQMPIFLLDESLF